MQQEKQPHGESADYAITIVTSSGSKTIPATGEEPLLSVVQRAFAQLGITKPANQFTAKSEAGDTVDMAAKIKLICHDKSCKFYVDPTKADQG